MKHYIGYCDFFSLEDHLESAVSAVARLKKQEQTAETEKDILKLQGRIEFLREIIK